MLQKAVQQNFQRYCLYQETGIMELKLVKCVYCGMSPASAEDLWATLQKSVMSSRKLGFVIAMSTIRRSTSLYQLGFNAYSQRRNLKPPKVAITRRLSWNSQHEFLVRNDGPSALTSTPGHKPPVLPSTHAHCFCPV